MGSNDDDYDEDTNHHTNLINATSKKSKNNKFMKSAGSLFKKNPNKKYRNKRSHGIKEALNRAKERGQKLFEVKEKSEQMVETAKTYNGLAKKLANKSWFG